MELGLSLSKSEGKDLRLCMSDPPVQLDLLPLSPVHRRPSAKLCWLADKLSVGVDSGEESDQEPSNGIARKKLRLSKQQSAFLEDSFKEHNTLNPKQKVALAKQLNLRPRQVEVWFQNRRARTKLKQTEVDCEYLKRCCETLTEENRRLQKEVQELRALKANSHPFYMHPPPTTLTMCPSCEKQTLLVTSTPKNHNHFSLSSTLI